MTQITALKELADLIRSGTKYETMGHTRRCQKAFPSDHDKTREGYANSPAQKACTVWMHGSLDAAKELGDAVLTGYTRSVDATAPEMGITVSLHPVDEQGAAVPKPMIEADLMCEAHSWLLAIIRAKISELES